jgi:hypothetical protein
MRCALDRLGSPAELLMGRRLPDTLDDGIVGGLNFSDKPPSTRESTNWKEGEDTQTRFDENDENEEGSQCLWSGSPKDVPWCSGVHEKMERKTFYTGKLNRAA